MVFKFLNSIFSKTFVHEQLTLSSQNCEIIYFFQNLSSSQIVCINDQKMTIKTQLNTYLINYNLSTFYCIFSFVYKLVIRLLINFKNDGSFFLTTFLCI